MVRYKKPFSRGFLKNKASTKRQAARSLASCGESLSFAGSTVWRRRGESKARRSGLEIGPRASPGRREMNASSTSPTPTSRAMECACAPPNPEADRGAHEGRTIELSSRCRCILKSATATSLFVMLLAFGALQIHVSFNNDPGGDVLLRRRASLSEIHMETGVLKRRNAAVIY